ncbi:MAG: KpsF/GutQ family sugar-phosphate isomerase [Gemmataceae bacterium]|nr:KpsF/GutQ family sugar-phosphate isomerase [Gemmataceae bacterium]
MLRPHDDRLEYARQLIRAEAAALGQAAERLDGRFLDAAELLWPIAGNGRGRLAITGTGKSADIGQKLAGTFSSTGTRAYALDATKAVHGDLGMVHPDDVVLALSHSGESEEIVRLLPPVKGLARAVIGLTGNAGSYLARAADVALVYGPLEEVCPLGLAPSASTTAMLGIGDALAFVLSRQRDFSRDDFARYHPAGSLGKKLARVESVMRRGGELRLAPQTHTVREVFAEARRRGRRTGAVMLVDEAGRLAGLFTDSDLARLIEDRREAELDAPISRVMTAKPLTLAVGARVAEALDLMQRRKISELPIVDADGKPVGLVDVTDLVSLDASAAEPARERRKSA